MKFTENWIEAINFPSIIAIFHEQIEDWTFPEYILKMKLCTSIWFQSCSPAYVRQMPLLGENSWRIIRDDKFKMNYGFVSNIVRFLAGLSIAWLNRRIFPKYGKNKLS